MDVSPRPNRTATLHRPRLFGRWATWSFDLSLPSAVEHRLRDSSATAWARRSPRPLLAALFALCVLAASATGVAAQGERWRLLETWGDEPPVTAVTALEWPTGNIPGGLGSDWAGGTVYVCDHTAGHVRIYDVNGSFVGLLNDETGSPYVFDEPRDVVPFRADPADPASLLVMVSEGGADRVLTIDATGAVVESLDIADPVGVMVRDGSRWVVSRADRILHRFTTIGGPVRDRIDLVGAVAPERVAIDWRVDDDVQLLVADPGLRSPLAVRDRGVEPWRFGRGDVDPGLRGLTAVPARDPRGVLRQYVLAAGPDGVVQIDDDARPGAVISFVRTHDVELYFAEGTSLVFATVEPQGLVSLGTLDDVLRYTATSLQTFTRPRRIAVDDLVLLSEDSPRAQVLRRTREVIARIQLSRAPNPALPVRDVATSGGDGFLLTGTFGGAVTHILEDPGGRGVVGGNRNWIAESPRIITAIDADERGHLALLDALNQEALVLDFVAGSERAVDLRTANFRGILDLAFGQERLFLADQERSAVEAWSDTGVHLWTTEIVGGVDAITAGPVGDVFALSDSGWATHLSADGSLLGSWPAGTPAESPADIAHGADGRVYVTDYIRDLRVYARDPSAPPPGARITGASPCVLQGDKAAAPDEILLGETIEVSLVVDGRCPAERDEANVALVIDRSGSMQGEKIIAARDAAFTFAARTDPALVKIGIVPFNNTSNVDHPIRDPDRRAMAGVLGALSAGGGTDISGALEAAIAELSQARRPNAKRVIVLLSDGRHNGAGDLRAVAAGARQSGHLIYTIALGGDAYESELKAVAGDDDRYYFSPSPFDLLNIYREIALRVEADTLFRSAELVDVVPANMEYVVGSGSPVEPAWDSVDSTLTWTFADLPEPGFRVRYSLRPLEEGTHPTNVRADVEFIDGFGHAGRVEMPVPIVRVLRPGDPTGTPWTPQPTPTDGPSPTPTLTPPVGATSIPATATATRTPAATTAATTAPTRAPTPSGTPTPSATPLDGGGSATPPGPGASATPDLVANRIYLPVIVHESCTTMRRLVDVVLVVDASTSMRDTRNAAGRSRLEAAYMAAERFTRQLVMPGDRAAVVSFNSQADLLQGLTGERIYVQAALARIQSRMQTRLDLGIAVARDELATNGRGHVERAIVVLTDGLANPVPMDVAVAEADAARALGITIHTVGLGDTIDQPGLERIAGHRSRFHHATDDDDLGELYERIAARLPCPGRWFWGKRP